MRPVSKAAMASAPFAGCVPSPMSPQLGELLGALGSVLTHAAMLRPPAPVLESPAAAPVAELTLAPELTLKVSVSVELDLELAPQQACT